MAEQHKLSAEVLKRSAEQETLDIAAAKPPRDTTFVAWMLAAGVMGGLVVAAADLILRRYRASPNS